MVGRFIKTKLEKHFKVCAIPLFAYKDSENLQQSFGVQHWLFFVNQMNLLTHRHKQVTLVTFSTLIIQLLIKSSFFACLHIMSIMISLICNSLETPK